MKPTTAGPFGRLVCALAFAITWSAFGQETPVAAPPGHTEDGQVISRCSTIKRSSATTGLRRVPEQRKGGEPAALLGIVRTAEGTPIPGVHVVLKPISAGGSANDTTMGDGIMRISDIVPGTYQITFEAPGFTCLQEDDVTLNAGEVLVIEVKLHTSREDIVASKPGNTKLPESNRGPLSPEDSDYRELFRRPVQEMEALSNSKVIFQKRPNRWDPNLSPWGSMPPWERYPGRPGEFPYASGHWWDPFNINWLKGDKPVLGQNVFFNFTGTSTTAVDVRRLFVPSGVSAANPGSSQFFGKSAQAFLEETVRLSFDLFKGDTSFKPIDWQVRITPAFNINQLWARERGIVNIDVREGTSRNDGHIGLQEAFVEKKIADLSPNYDFISIRAGIQQFTSDFRGLLFSQEQPGVRVFGNLRSNRLQYNAAYFFFLEKDTNSGLNTLKSRHQQVFLASLYWQDSFFKGYTSQISYHYNKDDASRHFDENGFLVRPAPIGGVRPHSIHAHYIGWTSNGHIGKINVSHAIYQALGHDSVNLFSIVPARTYINAQMAALELSVDRDWLRLHTSGFFASGDAQPSDGTARGFDAISESQSFAGGIFSFFNREGIRLTGTGVGLVAPNSFLPNLRSSKEEGQANFVNPGIFLVNAGADFNLTTTLRAVTNVNYMRFNHTESLQLLLFQSHIDKSIGTDYSVGVVYRPKLSENIVVTSGVAALTPGTGLRQIYTSKTLVSGFTTVRFKF